MTKETVEPVEATAGGLSASATVQIAATHGIAPEPVDLADLDTAIHMGRPTACPILHPKTKADTGQRVWLYGMDSQRVQDYLRGKADAKLKLQAERAARGQDEEPTTIAQLEDAAIELLCVATDRWENVFFEGEANTQFTLEKAKRLYKIDFIRKQLNKWMGDIDRFM